VGLSLAARYIAQPREIVTHTRYERVDRPYPVDRIVERRVPVPSVVREYLPVPVRDTLILVPTGLREWSILPMVNNAPAITVNRREIVIPTFVGGMATEYRYKIPGERRFQLTGGMLYADRRLLPIAAGELSYEHVRLSVGVMYDTQSGIAPFGHLRIGLLP
jgi:hypothetical protein